MKFDEISQMISQLFGVDIDTFIESLKRSPNAQGYLIGAISEYTLMKELESKGFVLERISEKWNGEKKLRHHGDFYIRQKTSNKWYVLESKGLKSNTEKWLKLDDVKGLENFLKKWNIASKLWSDNNQLRNWCKSNYNNKFENLHVKILMTHFVSGKSGHRKINTARNDEFDFVSVDLYLRTGKHEFIYADPKDLEPSAKYPEHLQQNYIIDVLVKGVKDNLVIDHPWHRDINEIWNETKEPVKDEERQVDTRQLNSWRERMR